MQDTYKIFCEWLYENMILCEYDRTLKSRTIYVAE